MVRDHARRQRVGDGAPLCAWVSFADPHHPFDAPVPWSLLHDPRDVDLPPERRRDLERRSWRHRAALENVPGGTPETRRIRQEYSRMEMPDDDALRAVIANYYGMVSLDRPSGGLHPERVARRGGWPTTRWSSSPPDHGEWLGDHGLMLKGPMFYEGLLRVGLLAQGPGVPAGRVVNDPVSTLDLAATFGDYAGTSIEAAAHSRSLRPLIEGQPGATREHALNEWRLGTRAAAWHRSARGAHAHRQADAGVGSGAGELYDLANDPHESENRFDDPACRGLRDELTQRLHSRPADIAPQFAEPVGRPDRTRGPTVNITACNNLVVMTDEQDGLAGCAGHPWHTPHMDALAARGTRCQRLHAIAHLRAGARRLRHRALGAPDRLLGQRHGLRRPRARLGPGAAGRRPKAVESIGKLHYVNETAPTGFDRQQLPLHLAEGVGQVWGSVRDPMPDAPRGSSLFRRTGAG
ncbi:MAG: hypothetical protein R3F09_07075 [Burkholderiaceae bacterium]